MAIGPTCGVTSENVNRICQSASGTYGLDTCAGFPPVPLPPPPTPTPTPTSTRAPVPWPTPTSTPRPAIATTPVWLMAVLIVVVSCATCAAGVVVCRGRRGSEGGCTVGELADNPNEYRDMSCDHACARQISCVELFVMACAPLRAHRGPCSSSRK